MEALGTVSKTKALLLSDDLNLTNPVIPIITLQRA